MKKITSIRLNSLGVIIPMICLLGACATAPRTGQEREQLETQVASTKERFLKEDPTMQALFDNAYAYAIFPDIVRGAAGIGATHGRGMVYQGGRFVGFCDVTQGTIGLQLGGQSFAQVLFLRSESAFNNFKGGNLSLAAQATAVAASEGAAAVAEWENDIMVFTMTTTGLMFEAAVGGQRFSFVPASD